MKNTMHVKHLTWLVCWVLVSRIWMMPHIAWDIGKDAPAYVHSLLLDPTYNVPMPGNIGFVLLGRVFQNIGLASTHVFWAVTTVFTCIGVGFTYALAALWVPQHLAALAAFAFSCNNMVWYHGLIINSYIIWAAVFPAMLYFGVRFLREQQPSMLIATAWSLGIATFFRQDMVMFGSPLLAVFLCLGKASKQAWFKCIGICALCCVLWFGMSAYTIGGVTPYLARVAAQHAYHTHHFSFASKGWFEGLLRNLGKYGVMLVWATHVWLIPVMGFTWHVLRHMKQHLKQILTVAAWMVPFWYFAWFIFMGNAGLLLPAIQAVVLIATYALWRWEKQHPWKGFATLSAALGCFLFATQFAGIPLLPNNTPLQKIANVTFLRYSKHGLYTHYSQNMSDFGMDTSLSSVLDAFKTNH